MLYRIVNEEHMPQVEELWDYCFEKRNDPFFKFYFEQYCGLRNIVIGGFESYDEALSLQTMVHVNPYMLKLRGREQLVPYLVGVATAPEARGQHLFGELAKATFSVLRKQGLSLVTLMPIYAGIYLPYGFSYCYDKLKYSWKTGTLSLPNLSKKAQALTLVHMAVANDYMEPEENLRLHEEEIPEIAMRQYALSEQGEHGLSEDVRPLPEKKFYNEDLQQVLAYLYENLTEGFNGVPKRTDYQWHKLLTVHALEGTQALLVHSKGEPQGYMLYSISEGVFHIQELLAANKDVEMRMLKYADMHASEAKEVEWLAEGWNKTYLKLKDADQAPQLKPFMMARVLDAKEVLSKLKPSLDSEGELTIAILDNMIEENNYLLHLVWQRGRMYVEPAETMVDVKMNVAAFTQLYMGAMSASELEENGQLECWDKSKLALLDELLPKQRNWINEYF